MASGTASTTGRPTVAEPAKPSAAAAKAAPAAAPRATRAQTDAAPRPARAARQGPSAVGTAAAGLRPRSRSAAILTITASSSPSGAPGRFRARSPASIRIHSLRSAWQ